MRKACCLGCVLLGLVGCATTLTGRSRPDLAAAAGAAAAGADAASGAARGIAAGTVTMGALAAAAAAAAVVITSGTSNGNPVPQYSTTFQH